MDSWLRWTLGAVALSSLGLFVLALADALELTAGVVALFLGVVSIAVAYSIWSALHEEERRKPLAALAGHRQVRHTGIFLRH